MDAIAHVNIVYHQKPSPWNANNHATEVFDPFLVDDWDAKAAETGYTPPAPNPRTNLQIHSCRYTEDFGEDRLEKLPIGTAHIHAPITCRKVTIIIAVRAPNKSAKNPQVNCPVNIPTKITEETLDASREVSSR